MSQHKVAVRVDANARTGVGHAVRCLALAQELTRRGHEVTVFGEVEIPWVRDAYRDQHIAIRPASALLGTDHSRAVIDGYDIAPELGDRLRRNGLRVLAMVDGPFGSDQRADIYVDQNFGAQPHLGGPAGSVSLAGAKYNLVRDDVLDARDLRADRQESGGGPPSLLAVFGGTDPFDAVSTVVPLLISTGAAFTATVICPDPERAERVSRLARTAQQQLRVVGALPDLAAAAARHDAALTAAGSTVWELLTIGVPTSVVCVVDNQEPGYRATTQAGLVTAAGRLPLLRAGDDAELSAARGALREFLTSRSARARLSATASGLFDGRGRERVADALLAGT